MHTLLLADESITVQRVIALTFAQQDIRVVSVPNGQQAMEKMAAERPDIVLAGTSLPQVSGYDLARYMRGEPDLKTVPVLLLSGAFEMVDNARLLASGANGIIEKPVEPTVVIGRVKELLGLKTDDKPATEPGRLLTPSSPQPGKAPAARSSSGADSPKAGEARPASYSETLDAAFESLDQQLSRPSQSPNPSPSSGKVVPRNPAGPLGPAPVGGDPHPPVSKATDAAAPSTKNPVYEVDDDWFGDKESKAREDAKAGRRDIAEDLSDPQLAPPATSKAATPVYEVDEDWFKEQDKTRAAREREQQQLAEEMGIHDVDLPEVTGNQGVPVAASSDFDLSFLTPKEGSPAQQTPPVDAPVAEPAQPIAVAPVAAAPVAQAITAPSSIPAAPPEVRVVTPEISASMLDDIAARVADRLAAGAFGAEFRASAIAVVRETVEKSVSETVRPVVTETSERVVREAVGQTAERAVREAAAETCERVVREVVGETSQRVVRDVAAETMDRVVRDAVAQTSDRAVREVVGETSERAVREVVADTSARVVREVVGETAERVVREVVGETAERVVRDTITATMERIVREVVAESADRAVRETVSQVVDRAVREAVSQVADHAVREAVSHVADRGVRESVSHVADHAVRDTVSHVAERVVREVVSQNIDRVIREAIGETADRAIRDAVSHSVDRAVPDAVSHATERVVREVVPHAAERVVREVVGHTADRAVRDVISETSERLVREEIERIKSRSRT